MHQPTSLSTSSVDYYDSFKKLYYHLYSNSSASRAERIISDISKLILSVLAASSSREQHIIQSFINGEKSANEELLHLVKSKYPNIFDDSDQFAIDDRSLRMGLNSIWLLDLKNAPSHLLGDAFQALIGPNLRGDKGQFFTPKSVVRCMIEILSPTASSKVVDPACGTGGFLTEVAAYWENKNFDPGVIIGIDKDKDLFILSSALLSLSNNATPYTFNQNSLDKQKLKSITEHSF